MNNSDDNSTNPSGLLWKGKKEFWVREHISDEKLDHTFLLLVDRVKDLVRNLNLAKDLELCNKWIGILLRTTKDEKYARNWLLKLMLCQLKNGGMSYPFTDPRNLNRDVCCVLRDYEISKKQETRGNAQVDQVASPLELKVPEPSSVSLNPSSSLEGKRKQKHTKPWRDVFAKWNATHPQSDEPNKQKVENLEILQLYRKKNYIPRNSEQDDVVHVSQQQRDLGTDSAPSKISLGKSGTHSLTSVGCHDRAARDQYERERKLRDIEKRKERELVQRRFRQKQRDLQKAKEVEKRKLQQQLLEKERILKEKDRRDLLLKVHQRREEDRIRLESRRDSIKGLSLNRKGLQQHQIMNHMKSFESKEHLKERLKPRRAKVALNPSKKEEKKLNPDIEVNNENIAKITEIERNKQKWVKMQTKSLIRQQKIEALNEKERQLAEELRRTEEDVVYFKQKQREAKAERERKVQEEDIAEKQRQLEIAEKPEHYKKIHQIPTQKTEIMERKQSRHRRRTYEEQNEASLQQSQNTKNQTEMEEKNRNEKLLRQQNKKLKIKMEKEKEEGQIAMKGDQKKKLKKEDNHGDHKKKLKKEDNYGDQKKNPIKSKTVLIELPRSKSEQAFRVTVSNYDTKIGLQFENVEGKRNLKSVPKEDRKEHKSEDRLCFKLQVDKQRNRLQLAEDMIQKIDIEKKQLEKEINARCEILEWLKVPEHQNQILSGTRLRAGQCHRLSSGHDLTNYAFSPQTDVSVLKSSFSDLPHLQKKYFDKEIRKAARPRSRSSGEYYIPVHESSQRKRWLHFLETRSGEDANLSSSSDGKLTVVNQSETSLLTIEERRKPRKPKKSRKQQNNPPNEKQREVSPISEPKIQKSQTLIELTTCKSNLENVLQPSDPIKTRISQLYHKQDIQFNNPKDGQEKLLNSRPKRVPQLRQQYEERQNTFLEKCQSNLNEKSSWQMLPIKKHVSELRKRYEEKSEKSLVEEQKNWKDFRCHMLPNLINSEPTWFKSISSDQPNDQEQDLAVNDPVVKPSTLGKEKKGEPLGKVKDKKFDPVEVRRYLEKFRQLMSKRDENSAASKDFVVSKQRDTCIQEEEQKHLGKLNNCAETQTCRREESKLTNISHPKDQQPSLLINDSIEKPSTSRTLAGTDKHQALKDQENKPVEQCQDEKFDTAEVHRFLEKFRRLISKRAGNSVSSKDSLETKKQDAPVEETQKQLDEPDKPMEINESAMFSSGKERIHRSEESTPTVSSHMEDKQQGLSFNDSIENLPTFRILVGTEGHQSLKGQEDKSKEKAKDEKIDAEEVRFFLEMSRRLISNKVQGPAPSIYSLVSKQHEIVDKPLEKNQTPKFDSDKVESGPIIKSHTKNRQPCLVLNDSIEKPLTSNMPVCAERHQTLYEKEDKCVEKVQDAQYNDKVRLAAKQDNSAKDPQEQKNTLNKHVEINQSQKFSSGVQLNDESKLIRISHPEDNQPELILNNSIEKPSTSGMIVDTERHQPFEKPEKKPVENTKDPMTDTIEVRQIFPKYRRVVSTFTVHIEDCMDSLASNEQNKFIKGQPEPKGNLQKPMKKRSQDLNHKFKITSKHNEKSTEEEVSDTNRVHEDKKNGDFYLEREKRLLLMDMLKSKCPQNILADKPGKLVTNVKQISPIKKKQDGELHFDFKKNVLSSPLSRPDTFKTTNQEDLILENHGILVSYEQQDRATELKQDKQFDFHIKKSPQLMPRLNRDLKTSENLLESEISMQDSQVQTTEDISISRRTQQDSECQRVKRFNDTFTVSKMESQGDSSTSTTQLETLKIQRPKNFIEMRSKRHRQKINILAEDVCNLSLKNEVIDIFKKVRNGNKSASVSSKLMREQLNLAIKHVKYELRRLQKKMSRRLQKRGFKSFQLIAKREKTEEKYKDAPSSSKTSNYHPKVLKKMKKILAAELKPICALGRSDWKSSCEISILKEIAIRFFRLLTKIFEQNINCDLAWLEALQAIERLYFQQLKEAEIDYTASLESQKI